MKRSANDFLLFGEEISHDTNTAINPQQEILIEDSEDETPQRPQWLQQPSPNRFPPKLGIGVRTQLSEPNPLNNHVVCIVNLTLDF